MSGRFVDDVMHGGPSAGGYGVEFTAQGEVDGAAGPVDEGHLARERLEQRTQGVMPTPPARSRTLGAVRRFAVKAP